MSWLQLLTLALTQFLPFPGLHVTFKFHIEYRSQVTFAECPVIRDITRDHGTVWGSEPEARSQDTCSFDISLSLAFYFFFPNQFVVHFPHESKGWRTKCLLYMTLKYLAEQENIQLDIYKTVEH